MFITWKTKASSLKMHCVNSFILFQALTACEFLCRSLRDTQNIMFRFYRQIFSLLLFNTAPIYSTDGNGMYFLFWFSLIIFRSRYNTDNV